jgi:glycosyltransferase 2 family protein
MKRLKRPLIMIGTLALMAGLLWLSSRNVEFSKLVDALKSARWGYLPLGALLGMLVFPAKAWRWQIILGKTKKPKYGSLLSAIMIGFMVNCMFSRIGELVRAAVLGAKKELKTSTAFASIALERIFDLCIVGLFLVISLLTITPSGSTESTENIALLHRGGMIMAVAFACGVIFLICLRLRPNHTTRFVLFFVSWLPKKLRPHIENFLHSFVEGLNALHSVGQVISILILSIIHWVFQVLFFYVLALCIPGLELTFPGALLVFAVSAVGVGAAPVPFYLGVYHGTIMAAMAILGGSPEHVASFAWICWVSNIPVIIIVGYGFLWKADLRLSDLRAMAKQEADHLEEELEEGAVALAQESADKASESASDDA